MAARLGKWLRQRGFKSFAEYYRHVLSDTTGEALIGLIDSLTTNHTSFLREKAHFEFLTRAAVEELREVPDAGDLERGMLRAARSPIRSPCAFETLWLGAAKSGASFRILATDISTRVLANRPARASTGGAFRELPEHLAEGLSSAGRGRVQGTLQGQAGDWPAG